eukprot:Blabericola_migrator_1__5297@NODE_271_length_10510_cov_106_175333_g226_i0_p7_GENE_NODE_271_length_10510_cov_106_175333_g226_i0NODE_271_length_10510_cov_106_175333_g226_i0_p7_ORF_typecomplete_len178_score22_49Pkinase/PF00069_25/5_4e18Pkinase_Tyr/PF07714_17/2_8e13Kinaselike/PF14531_6/2e12_NODE_271_length_10510_cov_106_175333_g226_i027673300
MAKLQLASLAHHAIKPSNVYITNDGFGLLLGDFIPQAQFIRESVLIARKKLTCKSNFIAPELYLAYRQELDSEDYYDKQINRHKCDVFSLGLVFYEIVTRKVPDEKMRRSKTKLEEEMRKLATNSEELSMLIKTMLTWTPTKRPSFVDLLSVGERASLASNTVTDFLSAAFGAKLFK